jgi:hypothetical protein
VDSALHRRESSRRFAWSDRESAAPKVANPTAADEANLVSGARLYRENCTLCYGYPAHPKSPLANSLNPPTDGRPRESYLSWKMAFGMEAWTPLFPSTSWVMLISAATLESM